jgi:protein phosphatase-4 regulatory subunit 3
MQEEFFIKQIVEKQVLGPVLDVLLATMPRDNLLSSGALELFEFIKKENVKDLVKYLVVNHREKLLSLSYMPTFRELLLRYDQTDGYTTNIDYFLDNEEDVEGRRLPSNARMEHIAVDPSEEEYWATSDPEEDEHNGKLAEKTPAASSASTPSKPLVDYASDEENDENAKDEPDSPVSNADSVLSGTPPERISEKRRREEDDEEDLGKLLQQNKRRNSSSASSNASVSSQMKPQRRKSFSSGTGNATPKKIAISLSPALKTGGSRSDEDS